MLGLMPGKLEATGEDQAAGSCAVPGGLELRDAGEAWGFGDGTWHHFG